MTSKHMGKLNLNGSISIEIKKTAVNALEQDFPTFFRCEPLKKFKNHMDP